MSVKLQGLGFLRASLAVGFVGLPLKKADF
jgi:hypothetical protein